jgi:hypothetical protein
MKIQEWLISATTEKYDSTQMLLLNKSEDETKDIIYNIELVVHRPNCLLMEARGVEVLVGKSLGRKVLQYIDHNQKISPKDEADKPLIRMIYNLVHAEGFRYWWTGPDYTCELQLSGLEEIHGEIKKAITSRKIRITKETVFDPKDCLVKKLKPALDSPVFSYFENAAN